MRIVLLASISLALLIQSGIEASGQEKRNSSIGVSDDCTDISVEFRDAKNLTKQERIDLMDKALFGSLSKYERCVLQQLETASTSNSGGGIAGSSGQSGDTAGASDGSASSSAANEGGKEGSESTTGSSSASSVASTDLSGTEKSTDGQAEISSLDGDTEGSARADREGAGQSAQDISSKSNGKIPDDIPQVDNDSVLEAQIRNAAMNEPDPEIREKLWNEYRKYKGLPEVKKKKQGG